MLALVEQIELPKNLTEPSRSEAWTPLGWKLREVTAPLVGKFVVSVWLIQSHR